MGFTKAELEAFRDHTVPDLIGPGLKLLFVGINPGLWTAATRTHFAHPGNRFYPALLLAGIIDRPIDRAAGMSALAQRPRRRSVEGLAGGWFGPSLQSLVQQTRRSFHCRTIGFH